MNGEKVTNSEKYQHLRDNHATLGDSYHLAHVAYNMIGELIHYCGTLEKRIEELEKKVEKLQDSDFLTNGLIG